MAAAPAACGSLGRLIEVEGGVTLSKRNSLRGCQNLRKIAVTTKEKVPPPRSVIGYSTRPGTWAWMVAKVNWNSANEPPPTASAGQTSQVLRQEHMHLTIHKGMISERNGS